MYGFKGKRRVNKEQQKYENDLHKEDCFWR